MCFPFRYNLVKYFLTFRKYNFGSIIEKKRKKFLIKFLTCISVKRGMHLIIIRVQTDATSATWIKAEYGVTTVVK